MPTNSEPSHRRQWISLCEALSGLAFDKVMGSADLGSLIADPLEGDVCDRQERLRAFFADDSVSNDNPTDQTQDDASAAAATLLQAAWHALRDKEMA